MYKPEVVNFTDEQFQVILDGLKSDDYLVSQAARIAFQHASYERLVTNLNEDDVKLQSIAAAELGNRGELRAVDLLLQKLDQANNWLVVSTIAYALGELQDQKAVEPLIKRLAALKDETEPESVEELAQSTTLWVRIILALTQIGGERVIDVFKNIQKYGDEGARRVVEPEIELLVKGAKYSKDKRIRAFEDYKERHVEALDWLEGALMLRQRQQEQDENQATYQEQLDEKQREVLKITDAMILEATGKDWQTWHNILKHWGIEKNGDLRAVPFLQNRHHQTFEWAWTIAVHYKQALKLEGKNLSELVWRSRSKKIKDSLE